MADLAITAANVQTSVTATKLGTAGAAITAGEALYLNATDGKLYPALCNSTAAAATFVGIALNNAAAGQPITYQTAGDITIGATVAVETIYVLSANAGGICPQADLLSTNLLTIIGYGKSATVLTIIPTSTGIAKP